MFGRAKKPSSLSQGDPARTCEYPKALPIWRAWKKHRQTHIQKHNRDKGMIAKLWTRIPSRWHSETNCDQTTKRATGHWKQINRRRASIKNTSKNTVSHTTKIPTGIRSNWQNFRRRTKWTQILTIFRRQQELNLCQEFNWSPRRSRMNKRIGLVIPTDTLIHKSKTPEHRIIFRLSLRDQMRRAAV